MIHNVKDIQATAMPQIRSGTHPDMFSNRPNLLKRDTYPVAKLRKKLKIRMIKKQ